LGDPDRSGLRCSGCVFRKWDRGWCGIHSIFPTAGDRGNAEPDCWCPTGAALRPTNRRGVSSGNRWLGREPPGSRGQPEGVAQEGRRKLKLLTPGRAHSSRPFMRVGYPLWGTECQRTGTARHTLALLTELQEPRRVEGAVTATGVAGHKRGHSGRDTLTGEPLGANRRTGWGPGRRREA